MAIDIELLKRLRVAVAEMNNEPVDKNNPYTNEQIAELKQMGFRDNSDDEER